MNLHLDIETIPAQDDTTKTDIAAEIDALKARVAAPANYKDPVKIAEYVNAKCTEIDAQADEAWRKTSLDGTRGHIVCISWAIDDGLVRSVWWNPVGNPGCVLSPGEWADETEMLQAFFCEIYGKSLFWVGHNIIGFDMRFIYQRAVILGVKPSIPIPHDTRGNCHTVYDTMIGWAGWGNRIKLDSLCKALGLGGKTEGIDGSLVWQYVSEGKITDVVKYCENDVVIARQVYKRMTFAE